MMVKLKTRYTAQRVKGRTIAATTIAARAATRLPIVVQSFALRLAARNAPSKFPDAEIAVAKATRERR